MAEPGDAAAEGIGGSLRTTGRALEKQKIKKLHLGFWNWPADYIH